MLSFIPRLFNDNAQLCFAFSAKTGRDKFFLKYLGESKNNFVMLGVLCFVPIRDCKMQKKVIKNRPRKSHARVPLK
jgi:hypothetical protein